MRPTQPTVLFKKEKKYTVWIEIERIRSPSVIQEDILSRQLETADPKILKDRKGEKMIFIILETQARWHVASLSQDRDRG